MKVHTDMKTSGFHRQTPLQTEHCKHTVRHKPIGPETRSASSDASFAFEQMLILPVTCEREESDTVRSSGFPLIVMTPETVFRAGN